MNNPTILGMRIGIDTNEPEGAYSPTVAVEVQTSEGCAVVDFCDNFCNAYVTADGKLFDLLTDKSHPDITDADIEALCSEVYEGDQMADMREVIDISSRYYFAFLRALDGLEVADKMYGNI